MVNLFGRVMGLIMILSQVDLISTWYKITYVTTGLILYGFFVHKESYEKGYDKAMEELVPVRLE